MQIDFHRWIKHFSRLFNKQEQLKKSCGKKWNLFSALAKQLFDVAAVKGKKYENCLSSKDGNEWINIFNWTLMGGWVLAIQKITVNWAWKINYFVILYLGGSFPASVKFVNLSLVVVSVIIWKHLRRVYIIICCF